MSVNSRTKFILAVKSGNLCAFPECNKPIVVLENVSKPVIVGEIAHIIAQQTGGPRATPEYPKDNLDLEDNLILLCEYHHKLVDSCPDKYSIEHLRLYKKQHEDRIAQRDENNADFTGLINNDQFVSDRLSSTLLPVLRIPFSVYMAVLTVSESDAKTILKISDGSDVAFPFIVKENKIFTFTNIDHYVESIKNAIDPGTIEKHDARLWWSDPDTSKWYADLLRRTLNKITGRKGLLLDKEHDRYYFPPNDGGLPRQIQYKSLTGRSTTRNVAWNPQFRFKEGSRKYWEHLAVALRFHYLSSDSWCLSIRPERRFTTDGYESVESKYIGRKSTRRKSRMYNINLFEELHFWRHFLSGGSPRIVLDLGGQTLIIDNSFVSPEIKWPGIPEDQRAVRYDLYNDDIFSAAELDEALRQETIEDYEMTEFEEDTLE